MNALTTCPNPDDLQALIDGRLREEEQPGLTSHLESCPRCQWHLQELAAGNAVWQRASSHLRDGNTTPEPALEQVVARLEAAGGPDAQAVPSTEPAALDFLEPPDRPDCLGRLAHYVVQEVIGRGGMGVVLKAFDERLRRTVAIKVLAPHLAGDASARQCFVREAQAVAALRDEHVIDIHSVEELNGRPYLVMGYAAGGSLQDRLDRNGPPSVEEVVRIGLEVASGLAAAHARGLVHRDIKPANILVEEGSGKVRLSDFGLARALADSSGSQLGVVAGTPAYMAPEQARGGAVDHRADLFSLGSVLYALCVGWPPFQNGERESNTTEILQEVREGRPRPVRELKPEVPEWLAAIIAKLHAPQPEDRFASAAEVVAVFQRQLAGLKRTGHGPLTGRRLALLGVGGLFIAAVTLAAWSHWLPDKPEPDQGTSASLPQRPILSPRILVILPTEGFHHPDYATVRNELVKRGVQVVVAAPTRGPAQPLPLNPLHQPVPVDLLLKDAKAGDFDALYFCTGLGVEELIGKGPHAAEARRIIAEALAAGKYVAALGTGPVVLADAGVLQGVAATCFKLSQPPDYHVQRLKKAGAIWQDEPVVVSGLIITGRDPDDIAHFTKELLNQLALE